MPKRPPKSGYARLTQTEDDEDEHIGASDHEDPHRGIPPINADDREYAPVQPGRRHNRMLVIDKEASPRLRRHRSNSVVDLKSLNQRLERWAEEIATKLKLKKGHKDVDTDHLEIQHSVFQAPENIRPATKESLRLQHADPPGTRMTKEQFNAITESVRIAIENGMHPKLIAQGSSGSYFATNSAGEVVGVFKPKDEEPYASRNPKWTKWIHRNLFPFFFGRACLIPNLSYISEAAAYVLDTQLRCNLVPYTDVVSFSSKSFFYDFWDRRAFYRKKKDLPEKPGSFQVFLKGYKDATRFFKEHPWPDQSGNSLEVVADKKKRRKRWTDDCSRAEYSDDEHESELLTTEESNRRKVFWTEGLQRKFRTQLERLVILDYIMRNTDRGSDNWMIRIDQDTQEADIVVEPPSAGYGHGRLAEEPYRRPMEHMIAESRSATPSRHEEEEKATVHIGAIDNSLSWPWKHPDAWRSYPFGWLFLPVSLIGQPFTEETRQHFLPLLTSKAWWAETQTALRNCFQQDADFKERMFAKQMAIMKGQAWNVVETLKSADHGPLELTRRARVHVWDDLVEVPVATPMRTQSSETRRKNAAAAADDGEEMDLSVASLPAPHRKLGELQLSPDDRDNPFNMSRQSSEQDVSQIQAANGGTLSPPNVRFLNSTESKGESSRDSRPKHKTRMSLDERRWSKDRTPRRHNRRMSHSGGLFGSIMDEDEADLGYAANADRESTGKMVIVERLETVKSKNPVFTWC